MFDFFKNIFSDRKKMQVKDPKEASSNLRSMVLHINPKDIGISKSDEFPNVWGTLMEIGMSGAVVTVVSLADNTTSIYFSSGGGFIGAGGHPEVANASRQLIQCSEKYLALIPLAIACPIPTQEHVRFHLLTFDGYRSVEITVSDVQNPSHPLHPLYVCGQKVITEVRIKEGNRR